MRRSLQIIKEILIDCLLFPVISSIAAIILASLLDILWEQLPFHSAINFIFVAATVLTAVIMLLLYNWRFRHGKKVPMLTYRVVSIALGIIACCLTVLIWISDGEPTAPAMYSGLNTLVFMFPGLLLHMLGAEEQVPITVIASLFVVMWYLAIRMKDRRELIRSAVISGILVLMFIYGISLYNDRPSVRYAGHGYKYMNGYSSTDLTDYTVYSDSGKLAVLDHAPEFMIEDPGKMPRLDGAEACYPVYAAVAKAIYKDIDVIERNNSEEGKYAERFNGSIVSFTNTVRAYDRLIKDDVDIVFGARPSAGQIEEAASNGVELEVTPIGREAFIFFVSRDNPVDSLTSEQFRAIYHGDINDWSEVGGNSCEIIPFQRPHNSGSQTMMEYFMGDVSLREPKTYEMISSMVGIISQVAQYNDEKGALGYSFRYFVEGLHQEGDVKILAVDGVLPTRENISNGSYPLTSYMCAVTRKGDKNPNVQKVIDFLLSEDGQYLIGETGYGRLNGTR